MESLPALERASFQEPDDDRLHRRLEAFNHWRLSPTASMEHWQALEASQAKHRDMEVRFVEAWRAGIRPRAAHAPLDPDAFVAWFAALEATGPGQRDVLFDWLARHASLEEMTWFLRQEVAGEAGFDDLVALTQVKMPPNVKLAMARNYWDELGQGHEGGMHGPMLARLARELGITAPATEPPVWESLALANLMTAYASHRRYAYESVGALGIIELTAPGRAHKVNEGLKRLGVTGEARQYFALHATLDISHAAAWNRDVIRPLVASDVRLVRPIAEGALMRLAAGERCFARYRRDLGVTVPT